jgi:hypothetical protein
MNTKIDFVVNNLKEAQKGVRFVDSVALALMILDILLLAILILSFAGGSLNQMINNLLEQDESWYVALMLAIFILIAISLVGNILFIIRTLLPITDAGAHVAVGDDVDIQLVNLNRLDASGRMVPSVNAYWEKLDMMSESDIANEYIYELQKYSYIQEIKRGRLVSSFLVHIGYIIGIAVTGFVLAFSGLVV